MFRSQLDHLQGVFLSLAKVTTEYYFSRYTYVGAVEACLKAFWNFNILMCVKEF